MVSARLINIFSRTNERSLRAYKNLFVSFVTKIISLAITFVIVPIVLNYVGKSEYGVWLTISSIINWFSYFDIGLGNGLRNKLAVAIANNNYYTARVYISSAYFLITVISLAMFIIFFIFANLVSWNQLLNTHFIDNEKLYNIVVIVFLFFCLSFSMKTLSSILEAMQLYAIKDIISLSTQIIGFVAVIILVNTTEGSLWYLSLVYGSQTAIGLMIASLLLFSSRLKHLRPSIGLIKLKESLPLINLGIWFFINQILYLINTQISLFIVAQLFGPDEVTVFNLTKNYMFISTMLFIMILTPFLSAFTEAYTKNDIPWIKSTMRKIMLAFTFASILSIVLIIGYRTFFNIWVNNVVLPSIWLIIMFGVFGIFQMYGAVYTLFLNGIGKIRLQFYTLLVNAILFIPFVIIFYKFKLGLNSLVIPGIIFGIVNSFVYKRQFILIIHKKATGLWNK